MRLDSNVPKFSAEASDMCVISDAAGAWRKDPSVAEPRVSVHLPKEYLITGLRRSFSAAVMAPEVTRLQQLRQHRTMQQNNSPLQKLKQTKKRRKAGAVRTANPAHTRTGLSNTSSWKVCVLLWLAGMCTVFTAAVTYVHPRQVRILFSYGSLRMHKQKLRQLYDEAPVGDFFFFFFLLRVQENKDFCQQEVNQDLSWWKMTGAKSATYIPEIMRARVLLNCREPAIL